MSCTASRTSVLPSSVFPVFRRSRPRLKCELASFAFAALAMLANIPWTLLVIMPVNRRLSQTEPLDANAETRALVQQWARLHAVRTLFGFVALAAFVIGLRR